MGQTGERIHLISPVRVHLPDEEEESEFGRKIELSL
jgi:hypothetical protein